MIGLGSNRLTVCRRGGMSVTQAGRGGMEWLAGVRMPSWASPYSYQATAALKAQFPTQWPTIRDYGFAHPEEIPTIELCILTYYPEDNDVMYSVLPPLGKDRWLVRGSSSVYIRTGVSKTSADVLIEETYAKFTTGAGRRLTGLSPNAGGYWGVTSGNAFEMHASEADGEAYATPGSPINVKNYCLKTYGATRDTGELQLYALGGSYSGSGMYRTTTNVYKNGVLVRQYVPFIRNNVKGYLNLLDGTMATNVGGSFNIELTPS